MERLLRWSALSGAVAVALIAAAVALSYPVDGTATSAGDPTPAVASAIADHHGSAVLGGRLMLAAVFFWVIFAAHLHGRLRTSALRWPSTIVAISGTVAAGLMLIDASFTFAMTESAAFAHDSQVAEVFMTWRWNSAAIYTPPLITMLVATLAVELGDRSFPAWFRWATSACLSMSILLSVAGLPGLATAPAMLWVIVASVLLMAERRTAVPIPATAGAVRHLPPAA